MLLLGDRGGEEPRQSGSGRRSREDCDSCSVTCDRENSFLWPQSGVETPGVGSSIPQQRKRLTFQNEAGQLKFWEPANCSNNGCSLPPAPAPKHLAGPLRRDRFLPASLSAGAGKAASPSRHPVPPAGGGRRAMPELREWKKMSASLGQVTR